MLQAAAIARMRVSEEVAWELSSIYPASFLGALLTAWRYWTSARSRPAPQTRRSLNPSRLEACEGPEGSGCQRDPVSSHFVDGPKGPGLCASGHSRPRPSASLTRDRVRLDPKPWHHTAPLHQTRLSHACLFSMCASVSFGPVQQDAQTEKRKLKRARSKPEG